MFMCVCVMEQYRQPVSSCIGYKYILRPLRQLPPFCTLTTLTRSDITQNNSVEVPLNNDGSEVSYIIAP